MCRPAPTVTLGDKHRYLLLFRTILDFAESSIPGLASTKRGWKWEGESWTVEGRDHGQMHSILHCLAIAAQSVSDLSSCRLLLIGRRFGRIPDSTILQVFGLFLHKQYTINWRDDPHTTSWTISAIVSYVHLKNFGCLQQDSNPWIKCENNLFNSSLKHTS